MNILWKMSKIAFREIVTMRTVQPLFKQGALERLIRPPKEPLRRNSDFIQDSALVPAGCTDPTSLDPSMQKQMLHQGRSIDQISNSVNHLQDTMSDLKHSFTALRIELNGPNRNMGEESLLQGHDFDMIATVLRELKLKSEEIEKLKLEIEALKLKNRYMGVTPPQQQQQHQQETLSVMNMNAVLPEVRSPGLLQAGRKRAFPDAFPLDRTIADSFDEDDMVDDFALCDPPVNPARVPLNDQQRRITNGDAAAENTAGSAGLLVEISERSQNTPSQHVVAKRPRLSQPTQNDTQAAAPPQPPPQKRPPGRPRKSISQPNITESPSALPSGAAPPITQDGTESNTPTGTLRRRQSRRSLREQSLGANFNQENGLEDTHQPQESNTQPQPATNKKSKRNTGSPNGNRTGVPDDSADEAAMNEKRKAKVAARDVMAKMALQHEEALEAGNTR
jgi:FtsZ-binding cell division protein ZapB